MRVQAVPPPSRYEAQKRRDWNTFGQYLRNQRPPLPLSCCDYSHVIDFLRYLDQFGKTKGHLQGCVFYGQPEPPTPCPCPLRQAWGSLDALIGRLRAAYEENGGAPESNPFAVREIRVYLREVKECQAKARGIPHKRKKRAAVAPAMLPVTVPEMGAMMNNYHTGRKASKVEENTIDNEPKTVDTSPNTVDNAPKTVVNAPKTVNNAPKTVDNAPKSVENALKTVENTPMTADNSPNDKGAYLGLDEELTEEGHDANVEDEHLVDIWNEMAFALEVSKDVSAVRTLDEQLKEEDADCDHSFVLKDDIGYVCRVCGIVQKAIESMIEFQYVKV